MSRKLANVAFVKNDGEVFLGEQLTQRREHSEQTAREIDMEVKRLIDEAFAQAMDLIEQHRDRLEALADALEEHETLDREALAEVLGPPHATPVAAGAD